MEVVTESDPGFKVLYRIGEESQAVYGGDGFVQPAMTFDEAQRLRESLCEQSGLPSTTFELIPLGEVQKLEASGPSRSSAVFISRT